MYWETKCKNDTIAGLGAPVEERHGFERIVGQSPPMREVFEHARRAAATDSTVLLTGESGTGKDLLAGAIHRNSPRKDGPFVIVNMAAVPEHLVESELFGHTKGAFTGATESRMGRFETANNGTIFIDEIGDFKLASQANLLRVLENRTVTPIGSNDDREVDVRIVAATSRHLEQMVLHGGFREDVYYRLNVVNLRLPTLRERRVDIPLLITHFLRELCAMAKKPLPTMDSELTSYLEMHEWPGNVRQLRNALESMIVLAEGDVLTMKDLPASVTRDPTNPGHIAIPPNTKLIDLEHEAVARALKQYNGNRTHAAKSLGISVRTLQRRLKSLRGEAEL